MKYVITIIFSTMLVQLSTSLNCNVEEHEDARWALILCQNATSLTQVQLNYLNTKNFQQIFAKTSSKNFKHVFTITNSNIAKLPPKKLLRFPFMDELWLTHNQIRELKVGAFDGLVNIKHIYLHYNKLTEVPEGVFTSDLQQLEYLNIGLNNIEKVAKRAFNGLASLKLLHLQQNKIAKLEKETFCNLTGLRTLGLNNNLLTEFKDYELFGNSTNDGKNLSHNLGFLYLNRNRITSFVLKNLRQLQWIKLNYNNLSHLDPDSFTGLSELKNLELSHNFIKVIPAQLLISNFKLENLFLNNNSVSILERGVFQNLFQLVEINLRQNELTEFHDFWLWGNSQNIVNVSRDFTILNLVENSITSASISNCKSIRNVFINNNTLSNLKPDMFKDLPSMIELDMSHNPLIKSLPQQLFQGAVSLEKLFINNFTISKLPQGIFKDLKKLEMLGIAHNRLEEFKDCDLFGDPSNPNSSCNNKLTHIFLYSNLISSISLLHSPNMKNIYLKSNKICGVDGSNFGDLHNLQLLDLSNNLITRFSPNSLKGDTSLLLLNLQYNNIGKLEPGTFSDQRHLKYFNISNNLLEEFIIPDLWNSSESNVESLDLSKNVLHTFYSTSKNLKFVNLTHNNISYLMPGMFGDSQSLSTINLSHNNIRKIQFGIFQYLTNLKELVLSYNKLIHFHHYLLSGKSNLHNLDLSNNQVDRFDVKDLKEHLTNLRSVSLANNPFMCGTLAKLEYQFKNLKVALVPGDAWDVQNIAGIACNSSEEYGHRNRSDFAILSPSGEDLRSPLDSPVNVLRFYFNKQV